MHDPGALRGKLVEPGILRVEIGGVPVYWAEARPPVRASLAFRVGRADETLASAGITRLVGHLAAKAAGMGGRFTVGPAISAFDATGTPLAVMRFLSGVTAALSALASDQDVSKTRREMPPAGPPGLAELALGLRWGGRGPGLARHEEYGLTWLRADDVVSWRDEWFTRANAAAWVCGPHLDGLDIALPDGERQAVVALPPTRTTTPVAIRVATDKAAVSIVHRASPELLLTLAERGAQRHTLSGELQHAVLTAPTAAELVRLVGALPDALPAAPTAWTDPPGPIDLVRWCEGELLGVRVASRAERAMTRAWSGGDTVVAAYAQALETALYLVGPDDDLPGDLAVSGAAAWTTPPAEGTPQRPAKHDQANPAKRLIVEPTAITLVLDDRRAVRISLAGATSLRFADGGRGLWSADGVYLEVYPGDWEGGPAAIAAIDRAIPAARTVPLVSARPPA